MNTYLKTYLEDGKKLYFTCNDKGSEWNAYYINEAQELDRVWIHDFMGHAAIEELRNIEMDSMKTYPINFKKRDAYYQKIASCIGYAKVLGKPPKPFFYFYCKADNAPFQILCSIRAALGIEGAPRNDGYGCL